MLWQEKLNFRGELLIGEDSVDRQIITDCLEHRTGLEHTWKTVNKRQKEAGEMLVGKGVIQKNKN